MWKNKLSRGFGKFASKTFPPQIQKRLNALYVKIFDIDMSEFDSPENYPTLNALFTRGLKVERKFDTDESVMISPCDSEIMAQGQVSHNTALQIKGMTYCVSEFLGEVIENQYSYINFYLSPKDYHRYHAPCDMEVLEVRYYGGELLPVNRPSLSKNHNLFIRNERVVVVARDKNGNKLFYVAVGALNVGQMVLHFEPKLQTNARANENMVFAYDSPIEIKKGAEMGMFKMGSTIVLFAQDIQSELEIGQKVKFGDRIARI